MLACYFLGMGLAPFIKTLRRYNKVINTVSKLFESEVYIETYIGR